MNKIRDILRKSPIISMIIIVGILLILQFNIHITISSNDLLDGAIKETIFAIITMFFVYIIAGKDEVVFSTKGLGYALKKS